MQEPQGRVVEKWVKEQVRKQHLSFYPPFDLEQVVKLLDTKLQRRLMFARMYVDQELSYANDWIDRVLTNKQLPERASTQAKKDLVEKLLDQALATDLLVAVNNNQGQKCVIAIDVTCNPTKEKSKLNTIQGKREDGDLGKFNRNQNLPTVRKQLGIDKHIVLVLNHQHLPTAEEIVNQLYAVANQPAQTRAVNLHSYVSPATLINQAPAIKKDLQQPNLQVVSVLEQLPERELIATWRRVQNYERSSPPQPPPLAKRQAVQQEVDELYSEICSLLQEQKRQVGIVEQMQKNPLRAWNKNYGIALGELDMTVQRVQETVAQKERKQSQLQVWAEQGEVYQAWLNAPQTKQIAQVAVALKHPSIQTRIERVRQQLHQKQTQLDAKQQQNQRRDRGQDLSL